MKSLKVTELWLSMGRTISAGIMHSNLREVTILKEPLGPEAQKIEFFKLTAVGNNRDARIPVSSPGPRGPRGTGRLQGRNPKR